MNYIFITIIYMYILFKSNDSVNCINTQKIGDRFLRILGFAVDFAVESLFKKSKPSKSIGESLLYTKSVNKKFKKVFNKP